MCVYVLFACHECVACVCVVCERVCVLCVSVIECLWCLCCVCDRVCVSVCVSCMHNVHLNYLVRSYHLSLFLHLQILVARYLLKRNLFPSSRACFRCVRLTYFQS